MFKKGEKVFHPLYGILQIEDVENILINEKSQSFYVLHTKGTKVMVPVKGYEEVGLRKLLKSKEIDKKFTQLNKINERQNNMDWTERYKVNEDKVKTGLFSELAEVVRSLYWVEKEIGLNKKEKQMYDQVHHFLVDELALAKKLTKAEAAKILNKALWDKGK